MKKKNKVGRPPKYPGGNVKIFKVTLSPKAAAIVENIPKTKRSEFISQAIERLSLGLKS
jgi:hypothetical protein